MESSTHYFLLPRFCDDVYFLLHRFMNILVVAAHRCLGTKFAPSIALGGDLHVSCAKRKQTNKQIKTETETKNKTRALNFIHLNLAFYVQRPVYFN